MAVPDNLQGLRFACDCVSALPGGESDPWACIAQNNLLPDGTKEGILNLVAHEPKTISQLAEALALSPPSVHTHINDMMKSELLRESEEWEKRYPTERYYEPNFPVVRADERAALDALCEELAERVAAIFEKKQIHLKRAFNKTTLREQGWEFSDLTQYLYANVQRRARQMLEERSVLQLPEQHGNGVKWVFWADVPQADSDQ
ncbi:MAG: winged helix-turn-helix domain-containing protein [Acidobacteria bacterium]|nr:winged helix-turn-helix domain-containing protein [Acidobacteriota bacterium]